MKFFAAVSFDYENFFSAVSFDYENFFQLSFSLIMKNIFLYFNMARYNKKSRNHNDLLHFSCPPKHRAIGAAALRYL